MRLAASIIPTVGRVTHRASFDVASPHGPDGSAFGESPAQVLHLVLRDPLPSRDAVGEAFLHLQELIFLARPEVLSEGGPYGCPVVFWRVDGVSLHSSDGLGNFWFGEWSDGGYPRRGVVHGGRVAVGA